MDKYREDLRLERSSINVSRDPAPCLFPPHWHSEVEIVAPMQNNYIMEINSVPFELNKDDFVIVFPCEIHSIKSSEMKKSLVFQFSLSPLTFIYEFRANFPLIASFHAYKSNIYSDAVPRLLRLLKEVDQIHTSDIILKEAHMWSLLLTFFGELGKLCLETTRAPTGKDRKATLYAERMHDVCSYILENYSQPISLDFISDFAGFSKFYFSRMFKKYIGVSFSEFLISVRLRNTELLLAENNVSISEAAMASGFGSLSEFNKVFKQYKGCSPSDFRKMNSRLE
ncbi:MAG: AraC family transcriptional regulator [Clostridiales bacterium]|nr:AraC family transcriptional regulator [Clostridiales bacterium]